MNGLVAIRRDAVSKSSKAATAAQVLGGLGIAAKIADSGVKAYGLRASKVAARDKLLAARIKEKAFKRRERAVAGASALTGAGLLAMANAAGQRTGRAKGRYEEAVRTRRK